MTLTSAISTSLSGLRATQAAMEVVSQNVSNAGTVGYTRRTLTTTQQFSGGQTTGVNVVGAQRILDTLVQKQLRLETSGAAYTGVKADYHTSLDAMFDAPGSTTGLANGVTAMTSSLSSLVSNPSSYAARSSVLSSAQSLASSLNSLSGQVQALRQQAEGSIGLAVGQANDLLTQIATVSKTMSIDPANAASAGLQDQRDGLIDQLSELMDVQVSPTSGGGVTLSTTGGLQLFDGANATTLSFDAKTAIGPSSVYSTDPTKRSVGTITATDANGRKVDALASGMIRSGKIAAYVDMRDDVLPTAQTQLDALAAGLASSLSDKSVAGTAVSSGGANGFDLDVSALQAGNPITVTTTSGGTTRTVTFVKASGSTGASAATASGDGVVGLDFSGGTASVASQIAAKLGTGFTVSSPASGTLRILDDGAANTTDVTAFSARATVTGTASGSTALPLFTDGQTPYTGSYETGSQLTGLAGRISVNTAVANDPSTLVQYSSGILSGDSTRPSALFTALGSGQLAFTGRAGIGGSTSVFTGSVGDFATQLIATQATDTNSATALNQGQQVVLSNLQSRMSATSGVNIDTEMAQLIQLQTAYGANARVMSAAKEMLDTLMRVGL